MIDWEKVARAHTPALRIAVLEAYDEFDGDYITPTEIAKGAGSTPTKVNAAIEKLQGRGLLGPRKLPTVEQRFWRFVEVEDGEDPCWLWTGPVKPNGYGDFWDGEKKWNAHRYSYELLVGPIPSDRDLDHLCRVRACVRPEHLEPVSHRENIVRGAIGDVQRARHRGRTHCRRGHELTEENTRHVLIDGNPHRQCRTCRRLKNVRTAAQRKQRRLEEAA